MEEGCILCWLELVFFAFGFERSLHVKLVASTYICDGCVFGMEVVLVAMVGRGEAADVSARVEAMWLRASFSVGNGDGGGG